jgi:tetratricopeptide (TPR) repeat protein
MKKYIKYTVLFAVALMLLNSCKKFVEVDPRGAFTETGYYRDATEAFNGLVATYDILGYQANNFVTKVDVVDAASDDNVAGGGGPNDVTAMQVISNYTLTPALGPQDSLWASGYQGVYRANILLSKLPAVPMDASLKARYSAEAKALRAYFYFDLVRLFKNIPLITEPVSVDKAYDIAQATPLAVYAQIESDLKAALAEPNFPATVPVATEAGRMNKGIVHALLGKVYLYEKKYTEAAAEFKEINGATPGQPSATYGYNLVASYTSLWKNANKFNSEAILEITHTTKSNATWACLTCGEGNILNIMTGPRNYNILAGKTAPDYISGYSFLPVTQNFVNVSHNDPRFRASVANLDSLEKNGFVTYEKGYMNTGYFIEKFAGRQSDKTTGGGEPVLNYPQDMYEIRLADTYLMEAEAIIVGGGDMSRATALITAVRNRAYADGLQHPVAPTLANIMAERRLELAFEGHRFFDLVRWGTAGQVLASKGFITGRNEILPIPLQELDNTKLKQSKEWGGSL